jgi:tol-pal system protein YbgF
VDREDPGGEPLRRAAAALAALALAGCSAVPQLVSRDALAARDRRILELEREVARARAEAARLGERVAQLERAAAESAARPPAAPAATPPPPAADEPAAPSAPARIEIEESDLAAPASATARDAGDASARYEAALALLRDGKTVDAESALRSFAAEHPDSELADNAWFWIGEARLVGGDAAGAIEAYRTGIERYPEGNKVPDALYKLGVALAAAGRGEAAREAWDELVRRFPTSAAAEAALARLEER